MEGLVIVVLLVACAVLGTASLTIGTLLLILTGGTLWSTLSPRTRALLALFVALVGVAVTVPFLSVERLRLVYLSVVPGVGLFFGLMVLVLCARAAHRDWAWRFATGFALVGCALMAIPFVVMLSV